MKFEFTYTVDELHEARRVGLTQSQGQAPLRGGAFITYRPAAASASRRAYGWVVYIGMAVFLFAVVTRHQQPDATPAPGGPLPGNYLLSVLLPCVPWLIVLTFVVIVLAVRVRYVRNRDLRLQRPMVMEVTPDGVSLLDGPAHTRWRWEAFTRSVETGRQFLLFVEATNGWIALPKRATDVAVETAVVRTLIQSRVGSPTGGFPVLPLDPPPA